MDSDRGERISVVAKNEEESLVYYKNYKTNPLLSTEILSNDYVRDTIPVLNWVLIAEKKRANNTYRLLSVKYLLEDIKASIVAPVQLKGLFYMFNEFAALETKE